jgi:hypothetical protein
MVQAEQPMHLRRSMTMFHLRWSLGLVIARWRSLCMRSRALSSAGTVVAGAGAASAKPGHVDRVSAPGPGAGRSATRVPAHNSLRPLVKNFSRKALVCSGDNDGAGGVLARAARAPRLASSPPVAATGMRVRRNFRRPTAFRPSRCGPASWSVGLCASESMAASPRVEGRIVPFFTRQL